MKNKSTWALVLVFALGLCLYTYAKPGFATPQQQVRAAEVSYAQLTIKGDQYTWDVGGNEVPRARTLNGLIRFLGKRDKPTFVNLLNALSAQGWNVIGSFDRDFTEEGLIFQRVN